MILVLVRRSRKVVPEEIVTLMLPMLPMYRSTEPQPGRQHTRPPHSAAASLSTRQAKRELELGET